ncbi:HD-domain/PDEase-like protein, partial [Aureobasidium melanogenum]
MSGNAFAVVYVDRKTPITGFLNKNLDGLKQENDSNETERNIRTIMAAFGQAHVCADGVSCLTTIAQLDDSRNPNPIVVLLDMPHDDEPAIRRTSWDSNPPSPLVGKRPKVERNEPSDVYGVHLLAYLSSEIQQRVRSRLVIPIAVLAGKTDLLAEPTRMSRFLDAGAIDVLPSPLGLDRVQGLAVHAYRTYKEVTREAASFVLEKRNRKLSWVGIDEERPYAYLREVMVSGLMNGICNPDSVGECIDPSELKIGDDRKALVEQAVGTWAFSAHDFDSDELLYAALTMLQHALQMPELEKWRISIDDLTIFLFACRHAYNDFVLYHNFRHIVDVLQAVFYFLLQIGILPPYPGSREDQVPRTDLAPVASLLQPFDALTLLISAIGHDVGHPGVNNAFLVALNAPLAQLYNDRSVLEAFHCAAYSQILRRYWPQAFADIPMRKLMINSILATDMGLHFKYMIDMGNLQEKLSSNDDSIEGWTPKALEETRDLVCGLLMKCADISNVARKYDVAARWAVILTDEFSNQGAMEKELNLPTCLFGGPPDREDLVKLAESQIGFMSIFAGPLFEGITAILPAMSFSTVEIESNRTVWEEKIHVEKLRRGNLLPSPVAQPSPLRTELSVPEEESEDSREDDIPPERDSLFGPSRTSQTQNEVQAMKPDNARANAEPASPTSPARVRPTSASPLKSNKKKPSTSSFHAPYSVPFHQHTNSRRSSKDAALEQLEQLQLGQLSSFSRIENQNHDGARRGSGDASLTTILVRSQTAQSRQEPDSPTKPPPSPNRQTMRPLSPPAQPGVSSSVPSSRSHATSNATATTATSSRFSNGSQDFASHLDASAGASGMGNLADELDFADSDDEDWDYDGEAEPDIAQEAGIELALGEEKQDDEGPRDSGIHVEQKNNTLLPHRNPSQLAARDADADSFNIFSHELEDALAQISRLANPTSHQNPDTISRTLVALQNLPPQQSLEIHTQRLTTSTNSLSSHIIQQTKHFASLSASLFAPFGFGAPLDFQIIDDEVVPAISQVIQNLPAPDSRALHTLSRLDRETTDLIQTLAALSDSLQMGRQTTASAARHLRNTQQMVSEMRRESDLADQAQWLIEKEDWDRRLTERYCANECRDVVGGFEQVFEGLRRGLEEKIAA